MMAAIKGLILESAPQVGIGNRPADARFRWIVANGASGDGGKMVCTCWIGADPEPAVVAKFARHPGANHRVAAEHRALGELQAYAGQGGGAAPRPLAALEVDGLQLTIETAVTGRPLRTFLHERRGRAALALEACRPVVEWIASLGERSAREARPADLENLVFGPLDGAARELRLAGTAASALARLRGLAASLARETTLPLVFGHNDLGTPNVLVDRAGGFSGIIDWESGARGLPATDLIYFLGRVAYEVRGRDDGDELRGYRELFFETAERPPAGLDPAPARAWAASYCAPVGLAPGWLPVLFALCWIMHARNERRQQPGVTTGAGDGGVRRDHFLRHLVYYLENVDSLALSTGSAPAGARRQR